MNIAFDVKPLKVTDGKTRLQKANLYTRRVLKGLKSQMLLVTTLLGVILGILIGIAIRGLKCTGDMDPATSHCTITRYVLFYLEFPGVLLINLLKMIILPLIMTSLIASLCRMSVETSGKLGMITIFIFILTTIIAIIIAAIFGIAIKPGSKEGHKNDTSGNLDSNTLETILDIFRNLCPSNLVQAAFQTAQTTTIQVEENVGNNTFPLVRNVTDLTVRMYDGMNALGIIAFSVMFGAVLSHMGPDSDILKDINDVIMSVIMVMVKIILWYSPIGIFFLLLAKMVEIDDLATLWSSLGLYIVVDVASSLVHMFIVLPILTAIVIRQNPFIYYYHFLQAILTAFATASSGATLGVSYHCAEQRAQIDRRISRFILPLGSTVHMDGTAIYEMSSAMFLAYLTGTPLNAGKIVVAGLMSALAAISAAGIPQGAIINLVMVLGAIGVPTNEIRLLYATDWLLDRVRTSLNVLGDLLTCVVLQRLMQKDLMLLDNMDNDMDQGASSPFGSNELTTLTFDDKTDFEK